MLSSSHRFCAQVGRIGRRCLFTNVVKEDLVLPFKYDFVTPELSEELKKRGISPDDVDRMYNHQLQNDHEFNNNRMPRQNSPLWGYVYGTQLARLQSQLKNITTEEEFARGYLQAHIQELELKMRRYYPDLNYQGTERQEDPNALLDAIEAKVTAEFIAEKPDDYIQQSFGNNWFVEEADEDDKYRDFLPRELDAKLVRYYQYDWDCANGEIRPQYVEVLKELEAGLSPRVDALKGLLVPAFKDLLTSLSSDLSKESALFDLVAVLEKCPSVIKDAAPGKEVNEKLLDALFGGNSKIGAAGGVLLGEIFGCNGSQFGGKTRDEVASVLATFDQERVAVVYKALQVRQSLESESLTKLLLTAMLSGKSSSFVQFMCGTVSVSEFLEENGSALDDVVSCLLENQKAQKKSAASLKALLSATSASLESKGVSKSESAAVVLDILTKAAGCPPSFLTAYYRDCFDAAASRGDVVAQIDAQTMAEYMETVDGQSSFYSEALNSVLMPSVDGLSGKVITGAVTSISQNSFSFLDDVVDFMRANGLLNAETARAAKGDLSSAVDGALSTCRTSAKEAAQTQEKLTKALLAVKCDYENGFDFDRIKNTYNPLNIVINQDNV